MDEIKIGDVVISDTKGPRMRVVEIDEDGLYTCEWTRPTGLRMSGKFSLASLTKNVEDQ